MSGRLLRVTQWEAAAQKAQFKAPRLADLCMISLRQLERFFDDHFQKSPSLWLRELQCRRAKELLSRGYSNKAVAIELKFASPSHFCREFKKIYGFSPQTFSPCPLLKQEVVADG